MQPDASDAPSYRITQAELESYRQLERVCRRYGRDLARKREELIGRMGGPDIVEPGPLSLQVVFKDSGLTTADEDGRQVPVINRYLLVYEDDDEFFGEAGDAAA